MEERNRIRREMMNEPEQATWAIALQEAIIEMQDNKNTKSKINITCGIKRNKVGHYDYLSTDFSDEEQQLRQSEYSPLINNNKKHQRKQRRIGVSERNEIERQVVVRALRNFAQLQHLQAFNFI